MSRPLRLNYRDTIVAILDDILANHSDALDRARDAIAEAIGRDKLVHVTGSGHSHMLAEEVFYRAGGLAAAQAVLDQDLMLHNGAERSTQLEREPGRAEKVFDTFGIKSGDVLIVASNSGRNAFPVEMALLAKARGVICIAITSLRHATIVESRHASGQRLFEAADIVLDNGGVYGDAALEVPGLAAKMGPTSTITGVFLVNTLMAEAAAALTAKGIDVDVYQSANSEGSSAGSAKMIERWRGRIRDL